MNKQEIKQIARTLRKNQTLNVLKHIESNCIKKDLPSLNVKRGAILKRSKG